MNAQIAAANALEILDTVAPAHITRTLDVKGGAVQVEAATLADLLRWAATNPEAAIAAAAKMG